MALFPLLDILRSVNPALLEEDRVPLLGHDLSSFNWEKLISFFKEVFSAPSLSFEMVHSEWKEESTLFTHFSSPRKIFCFEEQSLEGSVGLFFREEDFNTLFSLVFTGKKDPVNLVEESLKTSFYWFLGATIAKGFSTVDILPHYPLHFSLVDPTEFKPLSSFVTDLSFRLLDTSFSVRLALSSPFLHALRKKESSFSFQELVKRKIAKKTEIPVSIEGGNVKLPYGVFKTLEIGDLLLLDHCSYFQNKGRVVVSALNIPFFRGMLKKEGVKILETPLNLKFRETHMTTDDTLGDETHDDLDFSEIEHSMIESDDDASMTEEETEDHSIVETEGDDSDDEGDSHSMTELTEETEHDETIEEIEHTEATTESEAPSLTESSEIETTHAEEVTAAEPKVSKEEKKPVPKAEIKTEPKRETEAESKKEVSIPSTPIEALKTTPLDIIIELACISMPIEKLLSLQPGNMLEVDIDPENSVNLTVNGKKIAQGELLKLGDKVGVKLVEIY